MNARAFENYLALSRSSSASKSVEIYWGRLFLGPNLVSFKWYRTYERGYETSGSPLRYMLRRSSLVECVSVLHGTCLQSVDLFLFVNMCSHVCQKVHILYHKELANARILHIIHGNTWQYTIVYNTFYNGDFYQDNARQNTILTVRLFIKFNTFYHKDNYNAWQYTMLTVRP